MCPTPNEWLLLVKIPDQTHALTRLDEVIKGGSQRRRTSHSSPSRGHISSASVVDHQVSMEVDAASMVEDLLTAQENSAISSTNNPDVRKRMRRSRAEILLIAHDTRFVTSSPGSSLYVLVVCLAIMITFGLALREDKVRWKIARFCRSEVKLFRLQNLPPIQSILLDCFLPNNKNRNSSSNMKKIPSLSSSCGTAGGISP